MRRMREEESEHERPPLAETLKKNRADGVRHSAVIMGRGC
jgi:hypothetical protein